LDFWLHGGHGRYFFLSSGRFSEPSPEESLDLVSSRQDTIYVFDGMLLEAGTAVLPDRIIYAYVIHEDYPEGKPLVARG